MSTLKRSIAAVITMVSLVGATPSDGAQPDQMRAKDTASAKAVVSDVPREVDRARALLANELNERLQFETEKLRKDIEDNNKNMEGRVQNHITLFLQFIEAFMSIVAVLSVILIAMGFREIQQINRLQKRAESTVKAAESGTEKALGAATEGLRQIERIREGLENSWGNIDKVFRELPDFEASGILGDNPPDIAPEARIVWEDNDAVMVVCDQLRIASDQERNSEHFIKLAKYWATFRQFERAVARNKRAVALAPNNWKARYHLAKTLSYWGAARRDDLRLQSRLFAEARNELDQVTQLRGKTIPHDLHAFGWIADEEGRFDEAIRLYEQARELGAQEAPTEIAEKFDQILSYNILCTHIKAGRYTHACDELRKLVQKDKQWLGHARGDKELARFRETEEWEEFCTENPD